MRSQFQSLMAGNLTRYCGSAFAVLFVLWVSLGWSPANAETVESRALQDLITKGLKGSDGAGWRLSFATALHRYCESVLVQVPRNTPQEDQWIDSEFLDNSATIKPRDWNSIGQDRNRIEQEMKRQEQEEKRWGARVRRIVTSAEYARKTLREYFSGCSSRSKDLIDLKSGAPSEALRWVLLSQIFTFEDELIRLANIVGLVSQSSCPKFSSEADIVEHYNWDLPDDNRLRDDNQLCSWTMIHYTIIDLAVIPLLKAQ
jgi:hypothetical protein